MVQQTHHRLFVVYLEVDYFGWSEFLVIFDRMQKQSALLTLGQMWSGSDQYNESLVLRGKSAQLKVMEKGLAYEAKQILELINLANF